MSDFYDLFEKPKAASTPSAPVPARKPQDGLHPYAAAGVKAEIARLVELPRPWSEGANWDQTTYEVACNLLELGNSPWSGYSVNDAYNDLLAYAPADNQWGRWKHEEKWASAQNKVGSQGRNDPGPSTTYSTSVFEVDRSEFGVVEPLAYDDPPSWAPIDLSSILDGSYEPIKPTLMPRTDGACLLYQGLVHSFHGESESGKSLLVQIVSADLISADRKVLYVDFESDAASLVGRLRDLDVDTQNIAEHFSYVRPEWHPEAREDEYAAFLELVSQPYDLVVIDGVTEALTLAGASSKDNDEITRWMRTVPRKIAQKSGAAVVLIDHVTKDSEGRGRFAIGGQAKMAALDGAAYVVEVKEAIGQGRAGELSVRIAKDRPGGVRAHGGEFRKTDRTQEIARIAIDSTSGKIRASINPQSDEPDAEFKPTVLMEKVSRFIEASTAPLPTRHICQGVGGKATTIMQALAFLVRDGYVRVETGSRNAQLHSSIKPYAHFVPGQVTEVTPEEIASTRVKAEYAAEQPDTGLMVMCSTCYKNETALWYADSHEGMCSSCYKRRPSSPPPWDEV